MRHAEGSRHSYPHPLCTVWGRFRRPSVRTHTRTHPALGRTCGDPGQSTANCAVTRGDALPSQWTRDTWAVDRGGLMARRCPLDSARDQGMRHAEGSRHSYPHPLCTVWGRFRRPSVRTHTPTHPALGRTCGDPGQATANCPVTRGDALPSQWTRDTWAVDPGGLMTR